MGMNMLKYFSTTKWDFRAEKAKFTRIALSPEDIATFPTEVEKPDLYEYLKNCILGGRQYCLKEPLSSLPKARAQFKT